MHIMRKQIHLDRSELLSSMTVTPDSLRTDWRIYGGAWSVEDGWLTGKNPDNCPGMIIHRDDFPGNVMVDFEARTVLPCTHDIDFMWNGMLGRGDGAARAGLCRRSGGVVGRQGRDREVAGVQAQRVDAAVFVRARPQLSHPGRQHRRSLLRLRGRQADHRAHRPGAHRFIAVRQDRLRGVLQPHPNQERQRSGGWPGSPVEASYIPEFR